MLGKITASDRVVIQKVTQTLINRGVRTPCDIRVASKGGTVTLTGTVQYEYQRKNAVRTAGVKSTNSCNAMRPPHFAQPAGR